MSHLKEISREFMGSINGQTSLMGVIGHSIAYTKSPLIHNFCAQILGKNVAYLPISIAAAHLEGFLKSAWEIGATGFSITVPHKETIATMIEGHNFNSVNTIKRGQHGWECISTDGEGFARGLERMTEPFVSFEDIIFIGAGGATKSILNYLILAVSKAETSNQLRERRIKICMRAKGDIQNQSIVKMMRNTLWMPLNETMRKYFKIEIVPLDVTSLTDALSGLGSKSLCIQATSAPVLGDDLAHLTPALKHFKGAFVDLVYHKPSALYFCALAKDLVAQDGEAMLIEQARLAQEYWWQTSVSYEEIKFILRKAEKLEIH